jgi:hypothetical protein
MRHALVCFISLSCFARPVDFNQVFAAESVAKVGEVGAVEGVVIGNSPVEIQRPGHILHSRDVGGGQWHRQVKWPRGYIGRVKNPGIVGGLRRWQVPGIGEGPKVSGERHFDVIGGGQPEIFQGNIQSWNLVFEEPVRYFDVGYSDVSPQLSLLGVSGDGELFLAGAPQKNGNSGIGDNCDEGGQANLVFWLAEVIAPFLITCLCWFSGLPNSKTWRGFTMSVIGSFTGKVRGDWRSWR